MTQGDWRCSAESVGREEPLFATASLVSSWLLIEQPGAWGPDALTESKFPEAIAAELKRRSGNVRILLIRHRSSKNGDPVFFKAHSGGNGVDPTLVASQMPDPSVLLDVDFDALANGEVGPGQPVDHPIYLVCTHGRHDICCADQGRPLYRALSPLRPGRTWEVSHLGGDRFAGNLLVLPRGDYFGRVGPDDVEPLVSSYESGSIDLIHHRGRSIQPRLVQAAEFFLREAEGITGFEDVEVTDYRRHDHDHANVVFREGASVVEVEVKAGRDAASRTLTCRADEPGYPVSYDLVSITRVP
ncbi:MAG TPA: sucrase ferredoxin [Acidimicrobiia bacterium]|nr:sucrase ferredoxin [Acidimicrobiia bacterium]